MTAADIPGIVLIVLGFIAALYADNYLNLSRRRK